MSLAGGSYLGLSDGEAADPGSKRNLPCGAMPNILDQCYIQKNLSHSPQKWPSGGRKPQLANGKKEGINLEEGGNNKLPEPCVILYKKKLDFTLPQNKTVGCGLLNIGNTCYINSTLQCLLYLPPWYNYVTKEHQQECNVSSVDCIVCMFHRFLKGALNYYGSSFAPREIVDKLKYFCANMVRGRQEDAHEFLVSFVDRMQMSLLKGVSKSVDPNSQYTTAVYKVFGIVIRSQVRCKACGWRSNNYEFGLNVILGIKNARSLVTAFKLYTKKELMDGANAYSCDRCRQRQPAEKHLSVHKAPNVLIIQLLRYDQNEYGNTKLTHHIEFNESLDLGQFLSETEAQPSHHVYQLHGVLVHTGMTIQSGHYFAYVRGMDRKWYKMNDERVHEVSFEEVMSTQAYILFYVRKVKEPQQKPPAPSPALVKHAPGHTPTVASNTNYVSHKPVLSNGTAKSEPSGPSRPLSAGTNGGTPRPSINGSGDVGTGVNSNSSSGATGFGMSSILNRGTKELSSNTREKVAFKINRAKDRWNNTSCNGSKPPAPPAAESKMLLASGGVSTILSAEGKPKKLVAYDDESSDQESDKSVEPAHDITVPEKSGADLVGSAIGVETDIYKATPSIGVAEAGKIISERKASDLEMFASKRIAIVKPHLKRSSSDSDISARVSSVPSARTASRNIDRRLSSGDGTLEPINGKPCFAKNFELRAKPLYDENSELIAVDVAASSVNLTNKSPNPVEASKDSVLAQQTYPSEAGIGDSNRAEDMPDIGNTLPEVECNLLLTDVVMATDSSPLACRSKKRRRSGQDGSSSCKRSYRNGGSGSGADEGVDYVWVEKTLESIHHNGNGDCHNGTLSLQDTSTEGKPICSTETPLKRSKVHNGDRDTDRRSRSVESRCNGRSSSSHKPGEHRSHSNRQDRNDRICDQEEKPCRSKLPHRSSDENGGGHRSGSSSQDRSFDQDGRSHHRSVKREDRNSHRSRSFHRSVKREDRSSRRSRSSHRSSKQDDRSHRSRSSHRSSKRDDRSHRSRSSGRSFHQKDSNCKPRSVDQDGERRDRRRSHRDRRRSRSSHSRKNSDIRSSKSYDYLNGEAPLS